MRRIGIYIYIMILSLLILNVVEIEGAIFRVAKDKDLYGAQFDNIQDAVNAAKLHSNEENIIIVMDNEVYEEQVTIDTMNNLTIVSQSYLNNPDAVNRDKDGDGAADDLPTIIWTDKENIHPTSFAESKDPELSGNFQTNGTIRIIFSKNIKIEGFNIRGDLDLPSNFNPHGGWHFINPGVWGGRYPVFHGHAGIALYVSANCEIRGNYIFNNFFGLYVLGRNIAGINTMPNQFDNDAKQQVPLSNVGAVGNHLIEKNHIFWNSYALGVESEWGLGSTLRYNLIFSNYSYNFGKPDELGGDTDDWNNYPGGVIQLKDGTVTQWKVYNNTFWDNLVIIGSYWRGGINWFWADNLVGKPHWYLGNAQGNSSWEELMQYYTNIYYSIYHVQQQAPDLQTDGSSYYVAVYNGWDCEKDPTTNKILPDAHVIKTGGGAISTSQEVRWGTNQSYRPSWFESTTMGDDNFLLPNYSDPNGFGELVRDRSMVELNVIDRDGTNGDLGALTRLITTGEIDWVGQYQGPQLSIQDGTFVSIIGDTAYINFALLVKNGDFEDIDPTSLEFVKVEYYNDLPYLPAGSNDQKPKGTYPTGIDVTGDIVQGSTPQLGGNSLKIVLPSSPGDFALFHIVIKGKDKYGNPVYSNLGVFPTRTISDPLNATIGRFIVEFEDEKGNKVDKIEVGQRVYLKLTPIDDNGNPVAVGISDGDLKLKTLMGDNIYDAETDKIITAWPGDYAAGDKIPIYFDRIGYQIITASGVTPAKDYLFVGTSEAIEVTPAGPDYVKFYDPPSGATTTVPKFTTYRLRLRVYDRFGNLINNYTGSDQVEIESADTNIVKIVSGNLIDIPENGEIEVIIKAVGDVDDQTQIRARIVGKSDWQDYTTIKVGPPLTMVFVKPTKTETYVGDLIPVVVMLSNDGGQTYQDTTFKIQITNLNDLEVYFDSKGTEPVEVNKKYTITGIDTLYVTSQEIVTNVQFTIEAPEGYRVYWDGSLTFLEPPIVRVFITWSENDTTDKANRDVAVPISDGSITLYAWGVTADGKYQKVSVQWLGLGVFDSLLGIGNNVTIPLNSEMIGDGKIIAYYKARDLYDTTATITVLDNVDRVYILKAEDWEGNVEDTLKALTLNDTLLWNLGDSVSLVSIGYDTSNNLVFEVRLLWEVKGLDENNQEFEYQLDFGKTSVFSRLLDINDINAVGLVSVRAVYKEEEGKLAQTYLKVVDPVDNINVLLHEKGLMLNELNNGDTIIVNFNVLKRWLLSSYYVNKDSIYIPILTYWTVESEQLGTDYGIDNQANDTVGIKFEDVDIAKITVERNGILLYFYIRTIDKINYGIYPNPAVVYQDPNGEMYPKIYLTDKGDITDIEASIYDINGNLVRTFKGIGLGGDFKDITDYTNQTVDSTNIVKEFICDNWDGTNNYGLPINSGVYIIYFKVLYRTPEGDIEEKNFKTKFYFIGKKE